MMGTATFTNLGMKHPKSAAANRAANQENFNPSFTGRPIRPPMRTIYFYSVSKRAWTVHHDAFPNLTLAGCVNGERWVRCTSIPDPVIQASPDQERGGSRTDENDGWIIALDMLCPGNYTLDPYTGSSQPNYYESFSGNNKICEGLWPSLNEEPTEEEIVRAEKCRDKRYQFLTREARRLAAISTVQLNEFLLSCPEVHTAMDALGLKATWHENNEVKAVCRNCGDAIPQGILFHRSSAGVLCVLDWKGAVEAGAVKREDVPEGKRWQGFGRLATA